MRKKLFNLSLLLTLMIMCFTNSVFAMSQKQKDLFNSGIMYFDYETGTSVCDSKLPITNGSIDRFLQVLAFQESRGNPKAKNKVSSASGKYQYINKTWDARKKQYSFAAPYATAADAPEEVQDAVAYLEYVSVFKTFNNDLFKIAVNHMRPKANTDPSELDVLVGGNKITARQYANMLIQNIGKGIGSNIPLKYSQVPEFAAELAKLGGAPPTINNPDEPTTGNSGVGDCANISSVGGSVVEIAKKELATGANEADKSYLKYTGGAEAPWCAYFVSWVFKEAGKPFTENNGVIPAVAGILAYARKNGTFHPKGEAGFTPQPGDVAIYKEGAGDYPSHVNIVISYDQSTNSYTTIGGNESNKIKQSTFKADFSGITGFMRVP